MNIESQRREMENQLQSSATTKEKKKVFFHSTLSTKSSRQIKTTKKYAQNLLHSPSCSFTFDPGFLNSKRKQTFS